MSEEVAMDAPIPEKQADTRKRTPPKLHHGRLRPTSSVARQLSADIPTGTDPELLMEPSYWAHHAKTMQPMDMIIAFWEDGSHERWLRVMYVGRNEVHMSLVFEVSHAPVEEPEVESEYEVAWISPPVKFAVRRKDDHTIIMDHLYPRDAAVKYLNDHLKKKT